MQPLNYIPVLGFETQNCHETRISDDISDRLDLGDHDTFTTWRGRNICKIAGYIPLIGTIVGLVHLKKINDVSKEGNLDPEEYDSASLDNKVSWIVRSSIEFLSLGFLLLIPDLIATLYRYCYMENADQAPQPIVTPSGGSRRSLPELSAHNTPLIITSASDATNPTSGSPSVSDTPPIVPLNLEPATPVQTPKQS